MAFELRQDPETGGKEWIDPETGERSGVDPSIFSAQGLGFTAPTFAYGGEDGTTRYGSRALESIDNIPVSSFQAQRVGRGYQVLNPRTGQMEEAVMPAMGGGPVPLSLAQKYLPNAYRGLTDVNNSGGFFEDVALPMIIGGIATGGLGSMFGSMGLGSMASKALAGGLTSAATGGNPVTGAVTGAVMSGLSGGASPDWSQEVFGSGPSGASDIYDPMSDYALAPQDTGYNVNPDPYAGDQGYTPEVYIPTAPQDSSGGLKNWLKEANTTTKDTVGMGLGPLVLGGLGLAAGALGVGGGSARTPAPTAPQMSAAQRAYLNRPATAWDWDAIQAAAKAQGVPVSQLLARGWQNVTGGQYNKAPGLARGGVLNALAAGGGTGRSDSIDARLSDGEYVMDAETVAMLGDGSTRAGAQKLDQMREELRRHKGRALARGRISPDARSPLQYVKGAV